jgi:hypothetical protein
MAKITLYKTVTCFKIKVKEGHRFVVEENIRGNTGTGINWNDGTGINCDGWRSTCPCHNMGERQE